jgi:hypothetical protein
VRANPLGLPHPSAASGARRAAPPHCRRGEAAAVRPARVARGPQTAGGHAAGGHRCASPPCSSRAAPPPCSSRAAPPPSGRRQPAGRTAPTVVFPSLCFHQGKKKKIGSLCLYVYMIGGSNQTVGPTCRFKWWRFWVRNRVHLAYLG